jgi:hypothetical protein
MRLLTTSSGRIAWLSNAASWPATFEINTQQRSSIMSEINLKSEEKCTRKKLLIYSVDRRYVVTSTSQAKNK